MPHRNGFWMGQPELDSLVCMGNTTRMQPEFVPLLPIQRAPWIE